VQVWHPTARTSINAPSIPVTLTTAKDMNFQVYMPNTSTAVLGTGSGKSLKLSSAPQVTLIRMTPTATAAPTTATTPVSQNAASKNSASSPARGTPSNSNMGMSGGAAPRAVPVAGVPEENAPASQNEINNTIGAVTQIISHNRRPLLAIVSAFLGFMAVTGIVCSILLHRHIFGPGWWRWFLHPRIGRKL
jgi:hypothetical protein